MSKDARRTPRSIASRTDAADYAYLKASRGHELLCCLAPSHGSLAVTKMWQ